MKNFKIQNRGPIKIDSEVSHFLQSELAAAITKYIYLVIAFGNPDIEKSSIMTLTLLAISRSIVKP